jgi:hypothetical protein
MATMQSIRFRHKEEAALFPSSSTEQGINKQLPLHFLKVSEDD